VYPRAIIHVPYPCPAPYGTTFGPKNADYQAPPKKSGIQGPFQFQKLGLVQLIAYQVPSTANPRTRLSPLTVQLIARQTGSLRRWTNNQVAKDDAFRQHSLCSRGVRVRRRLSCRSRAINCKIGVDLQSPEDTLPDIGTWAKIADFEGLLPHVWTTRIPPGASSWDTRPPSDRAEPQPKAQQPNGRSLPQPIDVVAECLRGFESHPLRTVSLLHKGLRGSGRRLCTLLCTLAKALPG
jgi:hypothetical protein